MLEPAYIYKARLSERKNNNHPIYDADTIWLTVDFGFGGTLDLGACRLFGLDAPEMRGSQKEAGKAARDYVREKLAKVDWFIVETIKDQKGKYGRYLVKIWINGVCLNDELISVGHAIPKDY